MTEEPAFLLELRVVKPVPPGEQDKLDMQLLADSIAELGGTVLSLVEDQGYGCVAVLPQMSHERVGAMLATWPGRHLVESTLRPVVPVRPRSGAGR